MSVVAASLSPTTTRMPSPAPRPRAISSREEGRVAVKRYRFRSGEVQCESTSSTTGRKVASRRRSASSRMTWVVLKGREEKTSQSQGGGRERLSTQARGQEDIRGERDGRLSLERLSETHRRGDEDVCKQRVWQYGSLISPSVGPSAVAFVCTDRRPPSLTTRSPCSVQPPATSARWSTLRTRSGSEGRAPSSARAAALGVLRSSLAGQTRAGGGA